MERVRILTVLEGSEHFHDFPRSFMNKIMSIGQIRRCGDGERVCKMDEVPRYSWIVLDGALCYRNIADSGAELILGFAGPGSFVGFAVLADGMEMHSDVTARGATEVLQIPVAPLIDLLDRQPHLWRLVAALASKRLRLAVEKFWALTHASAPAGPASAVFSTTSRRAD